MVLVSGQQCLIKPLASRQEHLQSCNKGPHAYATFQIPGSAFPVLMSPVPDMCCWLDSLLGIAGLPELCHVLSVASCNILQLS